MGPLLRARIHLSLRLMVWPWSLGVAVGIFRRRMEDLDGSFCPQTLSNEHRALTPYCRLETETCSFHINASNHRIYPRTTRPCRVQI
ncbi:uncharacterized protein F4817DRAFT_334218 [Daldinia loculata]|uniref:uncharacterized protein n=1 Tax=Daldinia loculata TaxID=103429 RepID=UPI0020C2A1D4|nr:uncharacterized protein F4817DRAFT_334218 [Daldinia loculata]KAI1648525.1 hypothetical protein F4817DRAFT_334218 [Daldinia loculata]